MFHQILTPVAGNLFLSLIVGFIPIIVVLVLLGIVRRPAWQAALAGLIIGLLIAILVWQMPIQQAASSTLNGFAFALFPVMWIVWNAMWLYNIAVRSGKFELFRRWMVYNVPPDKRILLLIVGFSFGALMEGVAGFGTPVAIGSALLIALGFPALEAVTLTLIFNTTPVAFGALGVPITTLSSVTGLHAGPLAAMVGRQLPFFALFLPFYAMVVFTGFRSLRTIWPAALVAGLSFALMQFTISNFVGPELPDVLASLFSLICVILFVQVWKPRDIEQYRATFAPVVKGIDTGGNEVEAGIEAADVAQEEDRGGGAGNATQKPTTQEAILAWLPWLLVSIIVIAWTFLKVPTLGALNIHWAGLDKQIFLTLYNKPYAAIYAFQPLGTGTAILLTVIVTALVMIATGSSASIIWLSLVDTWRQLRFPILTVMLIIGLAYLYNYSGMSYTLGLAISKVGFIFPFFSVFLGWIACFLSGSDTSSNALFGNLQVVAARQLNLSPVLMAASNSSGAVMSKMISPQNVSTGVSTTELNGKEGLIIRRTFFHSIILATILGIIVMIQQYLIPGIIPH
ncbi:L-lactate permease [Dictyobacter aurantiacus]|uniref:L-lactate permease n=1 Tax=Dictyobacter aurantiacus TaxID=1936993 RepID=A0A401ZFC9_9CHLR|nr:L-lactate permease [Dictyobacter aurantiacus]GCE05584.1 glycolate permease GlcA [Dictyobacter aurantiacus]